MDSTELLETGDQNDVYEEVLKGVSVGKVIHGLTIARTVPVPTMSGMLSSFLKLVAVGESGRHFIHGYDAVTVAGVQRLMQRKDGWKQYVVVD